MASAGPARLENLQAITDAALAHLELEALLTALLERTREILDVDTCAVLLLDPERNELVARAAVGIEEEIEQGVRVPVGSGFAGTVAATRQPVILPDVDHSHVLSPILREKGIKSMLGVPLAIRENVLGVMHVGTLKPRRFEEDDVELLQLVADRAALAIDHARLFESERKARDRLERLQAVTDVALTHLALDDLLQALLQRTRDVLEVDTCAVLLRDPDRNELVARAALGIEEEVEQGVRLPIGRGGFAGTVADERRPVILPDLDKAHVLNPILHEKKIKSMLGVPLMVRDDVIGVMHVGTLTPRDFDEDDVALLQLVGERAALAIQKARVHEEMVRLDQMKLSFVAIASHELRTPAASVYGILTTLRARGDALAPEVRAELEESAWDQSDRLRRLIEQLLDLSRLDARSIEVHPQPVVLGRLLAGVAGGRDIVVDVDPALAVMADPLVIERVVANLVANARQHGAPPVTIRAEQRDRHLRISVEDRGAGVPEELVPRLFERFEHGEESSGTGLGLAIAKAYAIAHGGDLVYEPSAESARFDLVLPR